ncbi:MAG: TIGR03885 family FMN-dependent LLM class oxidoreductase [Cytophaga sp.]|uniref:TIGR03885 family FMN-dependent LLM class oxidoreductase n=1 Tax=Cytophaga sp. TaxID=29535 RepID=UPI003F7EE769
MLHISYHASHEQFSPSDLLKYVKLAEQAGFTACHSSDHFHPWSKRQGQSGFAFSWLGAAMEGTRFPFSIVTAPGQRYHPAIVAQAIATLTEMYPERLEVALGSGEALNEHITGTPWPHKQARNQRLLECADVIRRLLKGETVNHFGLVKVHEAKLYTLPEKAPGLMCAALSAETAQWAGNWADGLLTIYQEEKEMYKVIEAFRNHGGTGKPVHIQMAFSYARDEKVAREHAYHQWRSNSISKDKLDDLYTVEHFDAASEDVTEEDVILKIPVASSTQFFIDLISPIKTLGVDNIILHNVNTLQDDFINDFGQAVLPSLR